MHNDVTWFPNQTRQPSNLHKLVPLHLFCATCSYFLALPLSTISLLGFNRVLIALEPFLFLAGEGGNLGRFCHGWQARLELELAKETVGYIVVGCERVMLSPKWEGVKEKLMGRIVGR